jgi:AcrR family transcriptional regulator
MFGSTPNYRVVSGFVTEALHRGMAWRRRRVPSATPRSEATRERALQSAPRAIAANGFRGWSLAAVAAEAGLTTARLPHHFPSKEHLLVAVLAERDRLDGARFQLAGFRGLAALDRLVELVQHNSMVPRLVQAYTVLMGESVGEDHPARNWFRDRYPRRRANIAGGPERRHRIRGDPCRRRLRRTRRRGHRDDGRPAGAVGAQSRPHRHGRRVRRLHHLGPRGRVGRPRRKGASCAGSSGHGDDARPGPVGHGTADGQLEDAGLGAPRVVGCRPVLEGAGRRSGSRRPPVHPDQRGRRRNRPATARGVRPRTRVGRDIPAPFPCRAGSGVAYPHRDRDVVPARAVAGASTASYRQRVYPRPWPKG